MKAFYGAKRQQGLEQQHAWTAAFADYAEKYPQEAADFKRRMNGELPVDWQQKWDAAVPTYSSEVSGLIVHCFLRILIPFSLTLCTGG